VGTIIHALKAGGGYFLERRDSSGPREGEEGGVGFYTAELNRHGKEVLKGGSEGNVL